MNNQNKLLGFLGLCRKAGKLCTGFDSTKEKMQKGQVYLVLLASDSSAKTQKEMRYFSGLDEVQLLLLPLTKAQIAQVFGREYTVFGVMDASFAQGIEKRLQDHREEIDV